MKIFEVVATVFRQILYIAVCFTLPSLIGALQTISESNC